MRFLKLCNDDTLLKVLRDTLKANPIAIPEERVKPLTVLSKDKQQCKFIGHITHFMKNSESLNLPIEISQMPNLSSTKSKSINIDLGLKIMDGFLSGFGVNGSSIKSAFNNVTKVSFSFNNVKRSYVDVGALCKQLNNSRFETSNPISKAFINEDFECVLISSIIASSNFTIRVENSNQSDFSLDISLIENAINSENDKIKIEKSSNTEISFGGEKELAFAFTGFILGINDDGTIYYEGESDRMYLTKIPNQEITTLPPPMLLDDFGLNFIL